MIEVTSTSISVLGKTIKLGIGYDKEKGRISVFFNMDYKEKPIELSHQPTEEKETI